MVGAVTLVRLLHLVQRQGDWTFIAHVHIIDSIFSIENITIMCLKKNKKLTCRRGIARCFLSLNISLSHSRSLKVIGNDTLEKGVNP